ncbi:Peptide methionine sulfoxide reductase MsrB [Sinobacterium norvegicum]|uniref:Peptide methionine sulfoxide reductase MsrB n=1 Tax=Sinobacterium norvegicum TaxID=1641715 RepID=A0ABN8EJU8_9GAMM|nr:peptide-methionine (R)-S-oxide reductase MsrB [Sinobacterium norvegicum]CAH0992718.1 Peptide methionine sulfoxide reductase MsrB [Sinobacterium norvegicum]
MKKTAEQWRQQLDEESYRVCREKGTERPFTGKYNDHRERGEYVCICCGEKLFESATKFDAGCGWPSFYQQASESVGSREDSTLGMSRTEIICTNCDSHLGHVFTDGPDPTGLRYCVNSVSLDFKPAE